MATVANQSAVAEACPSCSMKARKVALLTVRALVKPELANTVMEETYLYCESPACDVVYFNETKPERHFLRSDLRVRVGQKATEPPIQICYCFDWTTDDIERELRFTSTTTIPDRIKQKVQQGFCRCETMNPQGTCCLGNVSKAVKGVRAKLVLLPGTGQSQHKSQGAVDATAPASASEGQPKEKGAFVATLGAFFTAIIGSACCWLPLLLIAFGFSAAGVGSFFEQYRPYLLCATFVLLAVAWYLMYRATLGRAWARLTGKAIQPTGVEDCCVIETTPAATLSCCATEPEPVDCCSHQAETASRQPVRGRFTMRIFNQVMLWVATVGILLFALFPRWAGLVLGDMGTNPAGTINVGDQQQLIVLEIQGMTCEGCAPTVEKALLGVPGVAAATVSYERKEARVLFPKEKDVPRETLLQAVRNAGYEARFVEDARR